MFSNFWIRLSLLPRHPFLTRLPLHCCFPSVSCHCSQLLSLLSSHVSFSGLTQEVMPTLLPYSDVVRAPPAVDKPENWRETNPRTGGHQPENWRPPYVSTRSPTVACLKSVVQRAHCSPLHRGWRSLLLLRLLPFRACGPLRLHHDTEFTEKDYVFSTSEESHSQVSSDGQGSVSVETRGGGFAWRACLGRARASLKNWLTGTQRCLLWSRQWSRHVSIPQCVMQIAQQGLCTES